MKKINNIVIITAGYPTPINPKPLVFLDQLACSWAEMGMSVTVICPVPCFVELKEKNRYFKYKWQRETNGKSITVYHPRFIGLGRLEEGSLIAFKISYISFQNAVKKIINSLDSKPDVLYSHFLTSGRHAGDLAKLYSVPGFCAFGESSLWSVTPLNYRFTKQSLGNLSGIVAVSSENKRLLNEAKLYDHQRIFVVSNGVDRRVFFPYDKESMRRKYGFPQKEIIGVFVGAFCSRKGVLRTQEAASKSNIKMIYIGDGEEIPTGPNILFAGKVSHDLVAQYLSVADFFVLPTRAEGCCNSILEAMACGLPIISSNRSFNDDILDDSYSIRIDPDDIQKIQESMEFLTLNEDRRSKMSEAALIASEKFSLDWRANRILEIMEETFSKKDNRQ